MEDFLNFLVLLLYYMVGVSIGIGIGFRMFKAERKICKELEEKNKELERKNYHLENQKYEDEKHIEFLHTAVDVEYKKQQNDLW
ncbi:hypothetical protein [Bernardetia sp.]|uniref:hypothetical protein n=1 Tax=Bernardetia sp. TaxID=1937974 RepID=UPI0025C5478F|nr:hypothetical protein [Bernardetia sp.]